LFRFGQQRSGAVPAETVVHLLDECSNQRIGLKQRGCWLCERTSPRCQIFKIRSFFTFARQTVRHHYVIRFDYYILRD
jgi:hypothetical protein